VGQTSESIDGGTETSLCEKPGNPFERIQVESRRSDLMRIAGFGRTECPVRARGPRVMRVLLHYVSFFPFSSNISKRSLTMMSVFSYWTCN